MTPAPRSFIPPMLAVPTRAAASVDENEWAFEMKWDGYRIQVHSAAKGVQLLSHAGNDLGPNFPELIPAVRAAVTVTPAILDGELVVLGRNGTPDFAALQRRAGVVNRGRLTRLARDAPAHLMIFDVLSFDSVDATGFTYDARRAVLKRLIVDGPLVHVPPVFAGNLDAALAAAAELGLEGVMAKRRDSTYQPGRRSPSWAKLKLNVEGDMMILGWRPSASRGIAAILLGIDDVNGPRHVGQVSGGWTAREARELASELRARDEGDERGWRRVQPGLIAEVEFASWTAGGRLRHPMWRGWKRG